ncbi:MAG TPA: hypothetical protein DEF45_13745 [Rhodopirellula sp.]|nr:hypothetical protein [Rhodopirellula sp.]
MTEPDANLEIKTFEALELRAPNERVNSFQKAWLQWNTLTLLLLVAVSATWFLYYRLRVANEAMRDSIQVMRNESKALVIVYNDRAAVISAPQGWLEEKKWNLAAPTKEVVAEGGTAYKLCLATSGLQVGTRPSDVTEFALPHGRHDVELRTIETKSGFDVRVLLDDQRVIDVSQPYVWRSDRGGVGNGVAHHQSFQPENAVASIQLYSMYYLEDPSKPKQSQYKGIELWLQPIGTPRHSGEKL